MDDCIFCKIVRGEIPADKVYEDSDVLSFKDINPVAPVHVLIIPKKHIENVGLASIDDAPLLGKIQLTAADLAKKLGISDAFRLLTANGKGAGQSVFHLHYHLVGGWKGEVPAMESSPEI